MSQSENLICILSTYLAIVQLFMRSIIQFHSHLVRRVWHSSIYEHDQLVSSELKSGSHLLVFPKYKLHVSPFFFLTVSLL